MTLAEFCRAYWQRRAVSQALNALHFHEMGIDDDTVVANAAAILRRAAA